MALQGFPGERRLIVAAIPVRERPEKDQLLPQAALINTVFIADKGCDMLLVVVLRDAPLCFGKRPQVSSQTSGCLDASSDMQDIPSVGARFIFDQNPDDRLHAMG